ncbi:hypothetical protein SRHO_G00332140 [Serrasalmus rhombeus]
MEFSMDGGSRDESSAPIRAHQVGQGKGEGARQHHWAKPASQPDTHSFTPTRTPNPPTMLSSVSVLCLCSLLLLNLAGAKPLSGLQAIKELLEEEQEANVPYLGTEDASMEHRGSSPEDSGTENALERVLGDLLAVSKRSWSRFKKGGLRSCFGVRLERIGSFSGLGC